LYLIQTLVYENYNKFISATDTIRTMKQDFRSMEDEMEKLTANMSAITELNAKINSTMHVSSVNHVLRQLFCNSINDRQCFLASEHLYHGINM